MAQTKNIDIIPNDAIKRVHVSQGDIGRTIYFNLYEGSLAYTPTSGDVITCVGTKPSGLGFTVNCTWSGNVVTCVTTEGMTDESGSIETELVITSSDESTVLGTSNFVLVVEKNPHPSDTTDGTQTTAQSLQVQIDNLDTRVTTLESGTITTDTTLSVSGMPADAKVVGDEISDLNSDLGQYKQTFTMSNQYLSTFTIPYTEKFYFKLLSHPEATFAGCRIYGVSNGVDTELTSGNFIHREFYWSVPTVYDSIKMTAGFGTRVSGDVTVILADVEGLTVSSETVHSALSLKDLIRSVKSNLSGDLYEDVPFITGKNIVSDFTKCNVDDYVDILQDSSVGSISARAIKIRDDDGNLYSDIYFITPTTRASDNMCWTFDKNGNPIGAITGANLNNGFSSSVYYIVLVNYWGLKTVKALYDADKEYVFVVGTSGKLYSSVIECLTRIAHVPYKKKVLIYSGTYDIYSEIGGDDFANAIESGTNWRTVSVVAENNTTIIGIGRVVLQMTPTNINSTASTLLSPLNISGNVTVENIGIVCSNCRYGIHIEGSNLADYNNTKCVLKNVRVIRNHATDGVAYDAPAIGVGMNARSNLTIEDCYVNALGGWAGLYFHENTTTEVLSPSLTIINSIFKITSGYALALSASANQTTMIDTYIASSYIQSLRKMTGGSSAFSDAYKIKMLNCNMPDISASDLMENEVAIEHYNTIA